jgi:uncharacterized protein (UPF0254 family)
MTDVRRFADAVRHKANSSYADFRITQILRSYKMKIVSILISLQIFPVAGIKSVMRKKRRKNTAG